MNDNLLSPERQTESPEYMEVDGFEGFFYETSERRIIEFSEDSSGESEVDIGTVDELDDEVHIDEDEWLLLREILSLKGEVEILS